MKHVSFRYNLRTLGKRTASVQKHSFSRDGAPRPQPPKGGVICSPVRAPPNPATNPPFPSARPPVFIRRHDARFWVCFRRFRNKCDDGERPQGQHLCLRPVFSPTAFVRLLRPLRCYAASLAPVGPLCSLAFAHQLFRSSALSLQVSHAFVRFTHVVNYLL